MATNRVITIAYQQASSGESHVIQVPVNTDGTQTKQFLQALQQAAEEGRVACNEYLTGRLAVANETSINTAEASNEEEGEEGEEDDDDDDSSTNEVNKRNDITLVASDLTKKPKLT